MSVKLRDEGFRFERVAQHMAEKFQGPQPLGSVVVEQANREIWIGVIGWGSWLHVSSPYSSLELMRGVALHIGADPHGLWTGAARAWLHQLQDTLDASRRPADAAAPNSRSRDRSPFATATALAAAVLVSACGGGTGGTAVPNGADGLQVKAGGYGEPHASQIRPGVEISSPFGSCTSNFIYRAPDGGLLIGAAAHCFSADGNTGVDPCNAASMQPGEDGITIENARYTGRLYYSSWVAMQQAGETPGSAQCRLNDFALVRIDPRDADNVHPAALAFGGPTALYSGTAVSGDLVYSYGQSPLHAGLQTLQEKQGEILAATDSGLNYRVRTDNPSLFGDSGSGVLHEDGRALGILVTVGIGLDGASNGVTSLDRALRYSRPYTGRLRLETWADFSP